MVLCNKNGLSKKSYTMLLTSQYYQGFYFWRYRFKIKSIGKICFPFSGTKLIVFNMYQEISEFGNLRKKVIPVLTSEELEWKHLSYHHSVQRASLSLFRVKKTSRQKKEGTSNPRGIWTTNFSKTQVDNRGTWFLSHGFFERADWQPHVGEKMKNDAQRPDVIEKVEVSGERLYSCSSLSKS